MTTHRPGRQHGGVVVDVRDRDDGGGGVGEAKVQVALHVRGLHDDGVLGDFLRKMQTHSGVFIHPFTRSSIHLRVERTPERNEKARLTPASQLRPMSSFKTSSEDHDYDRLKAGVSSLPEASSSKILPIE